MENSEELANYCNDTYCAQCRHSPSVVVRIVLRAIIMIFIQRHKSMLCDAFIMFSARCMMKLNGCYYRILTMVYNFQRYWVVGLYPSSWY
jgi:hypothetical protein